MQNNNKLINPFRQKIKIMLKQKIEIINHA